MKISQLALPATLAAVSLSACLALAVSAQTPPTQVPAPPSAPVPARDYERIFDRLWSTVNSKFFDPQMNGVDWRAVRTQHQPQVASVRTDDEFHQLATRMLKELKVTHLRVNRPVVAAPSRGPRPVWGFAPVSATAIDGDSVVRFLRPEGAGTDFRPGDRFLGTIAATPVGEQRVAKVEGCDGITRDVSFTTIPPIPNYSWEVRNSPGGERIGYFRLSRFDGNEALEAIDKAMTALADTDGLIIDVRGNTGGDASAIRLINWFAEGSQPAMIIWSRGALARLGRMPTPEESLSARKVLGGERFINVVRGLLLGGGRAAAWTEGRGELGYRKPVTVLIGPRTGSSGEAFAWGMKLLTPARLIGGTTQGALLSEETFKLPDGWTVTLPVYGLWGSDGESYVDRPVTPHEEVLTTRADLCAARDPQMDAAFRYHEATS